MSKAISSLASVALFSLSVLAAAQAALPLHEQVAQQIRERKSVVRYCSDINAYAKTHASRLFAQTTSLGGAWEEFPDLARWEENGKPVPVALVWTRAGRVVEVKLAFNDGATQTGIGDYCFRPDGTIARIRTVPEIGTRSDARGLHAELFFGVDRIYLPDGNTMRMVIDYDPRPLRSEQTTIVNVEPPEFRAISELPFANLLQSDVVMTAP